MHGVSLLGEAVARARIANNDVTVLMVSPDSRLKIDMFSSVKCEMLERQT